MVRKKQVIIGGICIIGVLSVGMLTTSKTKHGLVENINIESTNYEALKNNMVAMYTSEDGENYTEIEGRMPDSGYVINEEKSYCNLNGSKDTNAKLKTIDGNHVMSNLIKGDKCYLYFDKFVEPSISISDIIAANNPKTTTPNFGTTATTDEGVFQVSDGMYGGTSYYWRGAVENNYVKFANFCWRIVRINGDGSIRLIYDGTTCHENGTSTTDSIAVTNQVYNASTNQSNYVGWTYEGISQRTLNGDSSNAKTQLDSWYSSNITGINAAKVAAGKFCNDRDAQSGSTWAINGSTKFYYAAYKRIYTDRQPTLSCPSGDIYTINVGLIIADEVAFAGGKSGTTNSSYYLYNEQSYWTMSPSDWYTTARVFYVDTTGRLTSTYVNWDEPSFRPVINLVANIHFKLGTEGSLNNPYEVI